jgi:hypothetical protein
MELFTDIVAAVSASAIKQVAFGVMTETHSAHFSDSVGHGWLVGATVSGNDRRNTVSHLSSPMRFSS